MSEENKDIKDVTPLEVAGGKRKKGMLFALVAGVLILIATVFMILIMPSTADARKVEEQLKLGAKYLSELNYEQAIAAYQAAIEIEPKCTEAYLGLAEIYTEMGEFAKAEEILVEARKYIEDEEIKKIEEKEKKVEEAKKEAKPTSTQKPTATSTLKPTITPTQEPTVTPTLELTATPTQAPMADRVFIQEIGKVTIGDYVTFGTYEQDNDMTNGAEAIEWQVLDKKDGKVLLLSKYALDAKPYHEEYEAVTWETCTLRSWLNGEFYNVAFNNSEQKYIAETYVINEDNLEYGTDGGNDTYDKVFLLSIGDVTTYFDSDPVAHDPARRAKVTEYAKAQGASLDDWREEGYGNVWWWLRSPGSTSDYAAEITTVGYVSQSGKFVNSVSTVVRPALWIEIEQEKIEEEPTPTEMPTSTSIPKPTATLEPTPTSILVVQTNTPAEIGKASVGDYVTYGSYEQDNNLTNGFEALEWKVLDKKDGKVLLLSKYALDRKQYNEESKDVTWETCTLRSWLNEEFYNTAFSSQNQKYIAETYLINEDSPNFGTDGGNNTYDKVFLLSEEEALTYLTSNEARLAQVTEYAKARGCGYGYDENGEYAWWWLRTPSKQSNMVEIVYSIGLVSRGGYDVADGGTSIRPAVWLEVESMENLKATPAPTSTPKPTATATPKPTSTPIPTPTSIPTVNTNTPEEIGKAGIGDYVLFGSYEQNNNLTNGVEAIEWQVLDKKDGKVLLLSKYALDAKPYHEEYEEVTWETCTLRSWLNEEFYNIAFNNSEQKYIAETYVVNEDNPKWGTDGGNDTYDKVFLLSIGEVTTYFDSDSNAEDPARRAKVTEYAKAQWIWWNLYLDEYAGNGLWWLRSPADDSDDVVIVSTYGDVDGRGDKTYIINHVRPALWIEVE